MSAAFNPPADGIALDGLERGLGPHRACHARRQRPRGPAEPDERLHAGRHGLPEGPGLCAFAEPQPGRRGPAAAPWHAQRHVPAGRGQFNAAANRCARTNAWSAWPVRWAWRCASDIGPAIRDMNARLGLPRAWARWACSATQFDRSSPARWPTTATRPTRASPVRMSMRNCWAPQCKHWR
jgi:4-hydroxybutyrate dehydrogenase